MSANVDSQKRMMDKEEDLKRMEAASKCAAQQIRDMLSSEDVATLTHLQLLILGRLQDSNAVLSHFNDFSDRSFAAVANDFSKNTRLFKAMKVDLDHIFRRIRGLKNRLAAQYPEAFKESVVGQIADTRPDLENEMGWKK
ncbi:KxDL motif-containing protein 1 [Marchantia polymorpha subsp. ruderalis]|uniref:KxDL domain-containing protein n=2 Tax=Marchantia polymorpha TaxID=3197 RepID=A0AAF6ASH9_MARPO|nr:hypothetical protein MARPO_0001s0437 [Marchantia polymorpha]BBM99399.1 hypothetical protein Mp_1g21020 [Marchantia polymorpha subsp. ruderalis]|eukprot:PTQ50481.1 hypothetical protein MARPO_0001s0437 [Marchantia polymorpha]